MKKRTYLAVWGAVAALSLAAVSSPAADQDRNTAADQNARTGSFQGRSDKTLGQIERANKLIGKTVYSSDNQKIGKIDNLVVDLESGRVLYAVIKTGLVAGKEFATPPGIFRDVQGDNVHLSVDKAKFEGAPQFTKDIDKPEQLGQASFVSQVHQYFGQTAWWQGNTAANTGTFNNVHKASDVIGMKIKNTNNEDLGKVDNLMVDLLAGRVVYAILNPDSSLNLDNNFYALPPNALTLSSDQKFLVSDVNKDKLAGAPHFTKDQWSTISSPDFASKVYQYYGKEAWFGTGSGLQPTGRSGESVYPKKN